MLPILYSYRRCPYAMRARIALVRAGITVELREVDLRNKSPVFLKQSPKGTVPVLILANGKIIDESIDVVHYVYPDQADGQVYSDLLNQLNDYVIASIMRFKYHERCAEAERGQAADNIKRYFKQLDDYLAQHRYLVSNSFSKADCVILPHVRQVYRADPFFFDGLPYTNLQRWLMQVIESDWFQAVMLKAAVWQPEQQPVILSYAGDVSDSIGSN